MQSGLVLERLANLLIRSHELPQVEQTDLLYFMIPDFSIVIPVFMLVVIPVFGGLLLTIVIPAIRLYGIVRLIQVKAEVVIHGIVIHRTIYPFSGTCDGNFVFKR